MNHLKSCSTTSFSSTLVIALLTIFLIPQAASAQVVFNGRQLNSSQIQEFKTLYGVYPIDGNYWYDGLSGQYGLGLRLE